jgi:hypothetical protein
MDRSVTSWAKYRAWQTVWFIYRQTEAEECCWVTLGKAVAAQTDAVPRKIGDGYNHSPICPITFESPSVANARGLLKVAVLSSRLVSRLAEATRSAHPSFSFQSRGCRSAVL